ncbi:tRNA glutamyl-Q(34) synthetase GluQRS [Marinomonas mediterranea]|uniref:tRNA glutamyl-Q(34) synthetase GluQRS n=1 Tax=Marinomonas mediterranea TaxID=119864 RepID=UPI002349345D|nr:tRNA glutamyl-Q(34) synthetase GluQRS [Marinomonas mediterranea]WCN10751.1 tRNA glutamyl-Q(34) synthetase GluQRS [Marinomonas mediterranea]WCN14808.1 tRNA glutamyl-Q(34) synthetase GluQRS [Marinomonas mediterranea]
MQSTYHGRFAPSPTGPLHFGSLVAALASYLDAKKNKGRWTIRIEDVDGSRCKPEFSQSIITTLESYGLYSDTPILDQSHRSDTYEHCLQTLNKQDKVFRCVCTRQSLKHYAGKHPHICSSDNAPLPSSPYSWRLLTEETAVFNVDDPIQGHLIFDLASLKNNPILKRKDGYFSYQLAVVVDDHDQGINHLVRGSDLLDTTTEQLYLYTLLNWEAPKMCHIPVILDKNLNKISKQNHAKAIQEADTNTLLTALQYLEIRDISASLPINDIILQAVNKWDINRLPRTKTIPLKPEDYWLVS